MGHATLEISKLVRIKLKKSGDKKIVHCLLVAIYMLVSQACIGQLFRRQGSEVLEVYNEQDWPSTWNFIISQVALGNKNS